MVSCRRRAGTTAWWPSRNASTTRTISAGGVSARAASCTSTYSGSAAMGRAARARLTDSVRSDPPAANLARSAQTRLAWSTRSAGTATTTWLTTSDCSSPATARSSSVRPSTSQNAFGIPAASRSPDPAAGTTATTAPEAPVSPTTCVSGSSGSGGQNLVEDGLRFGVVGALGQRQLTDQNLAGLGQHALLARGQTTLLVATPQVAHYLGHLVHITGGKLFQIGLVAARPVRGLFGVRGAQHLKDLVEAFLPDDVADTDILGVLGGNSNGQVSLRHFQDEIFFLLPFDGSGFNRLD